MRFAWTRQCLRTPEGTQEFVQTMLEAIDAPRYFYMRVHDGRPVFARLHSRLDPDLYCLVVGVVLVSDAKLAGTPIGHRCGGFARCTTGRVEFQSGEPETMTKAEYAILSTRELIGQVRLSCQIVCDHDMSVHPVMTKDNQPAWEGNARNTP